MDFLQNITVIAVLCCITLKKQGILKKILAFFKKYVTLKAWKSLSEKERIEWEQNLLKNTGW